MKTESSSSNEVIWANVELTQLNPDECLPEIGTILSNLEVSPIDKILHTNIETCQNTNSTDKVVQPVNQKIKVIDNSILKMASAPVPDKIKKKKVRNFEDILYFVCNSCPFLCTKDSKINEHVENAHKNKAVPKLLELKCPACANIFYYKISLRAHLIHDHGVANSELSSIIQSIVYSAKKNQKNNEQHKAEAKTELQNGNCENETDLKFREALVENEKDFCDDEISNDGFTPSAEENSSSEPSKSVEKQSESNVSLPILNITPNSAEKMFDSMIKQNSLTKYLDEKNTPKCPLCKVKLQDPSKMTYHIASHHSNCFKCLECGEVFSFWKPLTGHLWRVHKIDMELYSCDLCDYKTFSLGNLNNNHKLIHSDVKSFVCSVCDKSFKNAKQLRNHKMIHKERTQKAVQVCNVCSKSFSNKRQLKLHMDGVHKKLKPFLCSYCGYKGASKSALKMHIRQHTGEKPFECDACDYTTADHNSLRRHKLRHTGEKPYKCAYCDYMCIQSSTYKVHLKTKHPGLEKDHMFNCHKCQFRSVNKDVYMSHLASVHNQKVYVAVNNDG